MLVIVFCEGDIVVILGVSALVSEISFVTSESAKLVTEGFRLSTIALGIKIVAPHSYSNSLAIEFYNMLFGYARVSTQEQDNIAQINPLKSAGCESTLHKKASGGRWDRPELGKGGATLIY